MPAYVDHNGIRRTASHRGHLTNMTWRSCFVEQHGMEAFDAL